jgi:hypothetical protein
MMPLETAHSLPDYFMMGGWAMYVVTLIGAAGVAAAGVGLIVALVKPASGLGLAMGMTGAVLGLLAGGAGALGAIRGRQRVIAAVAGVDASQKQEILRQGMWEASIPQAYGLYVGAPLMVIGALAAGLAVARRPKPGTPGPA